MNRITDSDVKQISHINTIEFSGMCLKCLIMLMRHRLITFPESERSMKPGSLLLLILLTRRSQRFLYTGDLDLSLFLSLYKSGNTVSSQRNIQHDKVWAVYLDIKCSINQDMIHERASQ